MTSAEFLQLECGDLVWVAFPGGETRRGRVVFPGASLDVDGRPLRPCALVSVEGRGAFTCLAEHVERREP